MRPLLLLALTILLSCLMLGCSDDSSNAPLYDAHDTEIASIDLDALRTDLDNEKVNDLTDEEIDGLVFMREEEKLARDVYLTFQSLYDLNIFANIAISEQAHTDAVLVLLERYGIVDPVGDNAVGVFGNEELQDLYDDLVAEGSESEQAALFVGCAIEEIDILDLEEYIDGTDHADLLKVYGNLLDGSCNHLRAFVRLWEQQAGQEYVPRFLSVEDYETIINDTNSSGRRNGRDGRNGGGRESIRR